MISLCSVTIAITFRTECAECKVDGRTVLNFSVDSIVFYTFVCVHFFLEVHLLASNISIIPSISLNQFAGIDCSSTRTIRTLELTAML